MSRVRPILFNGEMVRAILDGRKTVTRRLVKARSKNACGFYVTFRKSDNAFMGVYDYDEDERQFDSSQTPPCQPGDILYVRETWYKDINRYMYRANYANNEKFYRNGKEIEIKWHPSIHMPKEAARIWLKVTDVGVERMQDMRPVDVIKEGAFPECWDCLNTYGESGSQCCYQTEDECSQCDEVMMEWERLWNSTIKKPDLDRYGWEANPWVWVIEFERCERPAGWPG